MGWSTRRAAIACCSARGTSLRGRLQLYWAAHHRAHGRRGPRRDSHDSYIAAALGNDLAAMRAEIADHMRRGAETTERFLHTLEPPGNRKREGHHMTINRRSLLAVLAAGSGVLAMPFAARAEGTLEAVKKRGTFRVGVTQAPPWFSKDPKTGEWSSGLGVSMGKAMADKLGVKMETVEVSWGNSIAALQADKIDIMFMIDATPERKQAVDFPESPLL